MLNRSNDNMFLNRIILRPKVFHYLSSATIHDLRLGGCTRLQSTKSPRSDDDHDLDAPIKYSSSPASSWRAHTSRTGSKSSRLWYEPYVIMVSMTVFMVYFTILREENDIDEELTKSLYSRIPDLEEKQLKLSLAYGQEHNIDTSVIIKRLEELEQENK